MERFFRQSLDVDCRAGALPARPWRSREARPARSRPSTHQLIESLLKGLRSAVEARDRDRAESRLTSLRRALEAHFVLEEGHYFAAVRESHPELESDVDRLAAEHREMLSSVEKLTHDLRGLAWDDAGSTSASLESFFHRREKVEREVLAGAWGLLAGFSGGLIITDYVQSPLGPRRPA